MAIKELETVRDTVEAEDLRAVSQAIEPTTEALERRRQLEDGLDDLAAVVRRRSPPDEPSRAAAQSYLEAANRVSQKRSVATVKLLEFLSPEDDTTVEQTVTALDETIEAEEQLREEITALRSHADTVSTPPILNLRSDTDAIELPLGDDLSVTASIENLGGASAEGITVGTKPSQPFDVSPASIGSLAPEASQDLDIAGTATESGRTQLTITVSSDSHSQPLEETITVEIRSLWDYIERALEQTRTLQATVGDIIDRENLPREVTDQEPPGNNPQKGGPKSSGPRKNTPPEHPDPYSEAKKQAGKTFGAITGKLEAIENQLSALLQFIEKDQKFRKPIDKRLDTVLKLARDVKNNASAIDSIDAKIAVILSDETSSLVSLVESAKDARRQ
jgi:Rad3-related DNA helicase